MGKTPGLPPAANSKKSSASDRPTVRASTSRRCDSRAAKIITAFAVRADLDLNGTVSNTFTVEWPKGSGNVREYPEIDRVDWFPVNEARLKLLKGQRPLLDQLMRAVGDAESGGSQ